MAALAVLQQRYIVERLAMWDRPADIVREFAEAFGKAVSLQQVLNYDASRGWARERMAKDLARRFDETRKRFVAEVEDVALAHKTFRLRRLQALAERAEQMGNVTAAAAIYEQAAKEMGGAFTNVRLHDLTSKGRPIGQIRIVPPAADDVPGAGDEAGGEGDDE